MIKYVGRKKGGEIKGTHGGRMRTRRKRYQERRIRRCVHKEMCKSGTEANKTRYKNMKNRTKKIVAKAMKEAVERELRELSDHPNKVFRLVKSMKKDEKDVEGGRCMRNSDGRLNFSE